MPIREADRDGEKAKALYYITNIQILTLTLPAYGTWTIT